MGGGRREKTDVPMYLERHSFVEKAVVIEMGTQGKE